MSETPEVAMRVPWFLRPLPVFALAQLGPLALWLVAPADLFRTALQGAERAPLTLSGLMGYGLLTASFAMGTWLASRSRVGRVMTSPELTRQCVLAAHYVALAIALFSTGIVLHIVFSSGLSVISLVLASQANTIKHEVYDTGASTQVLMMGRHLVLAAMITWFVLGRYQLRRPRTIPWIVAAAAVLTLFTSSRLTGESISLIATLFWFSQDVGNLRAVSHLRRVAIVVVLLLIFAGGVWARSLHTWTGSSSGALGIVLGPIYEAMAYIVSPVNYGMAFIANGVAFVRGFGLDNIFGVVYTVLNVPVDDSYRQLISWNYSPALNQIGLLGEWFTIAGPLLWLPGMAYGFLSGALYERFRRGSIVGLLLYPVVLITLADTMRGFLLSQNIAAANLLYLLALLAVVSLARVTQRRTTIGAVHAA
jgi:hypothetical protein